MENSGISEAGMGSDWRMRGREEVEAEMVVKKGKMP
jgi:hypothetical protein